MCVSLPDEAAQEGDPNIFTVLRRTWMPLVLVSVLAVGAFAVHRLRDVFGSHELPTYAGSMSDDGNASDPKRVLYEIFGAPGTIADINYLDERGTPHQINDAPLPWSVQIVTNAPAMAGNILAQGDSSFIGCRITVDGVIKIDKTDDAVSAYVYCLEKAA